MMMPPVAAMLADTLLVRPVDVPVPWYSVASGVLSIVVTLLLLGIAIALLGMARALKGAEKNLGGRMQGLADELIPLARNLNQIATQLSQVTADARGDLQKLSGTIGVVDDAVRDAVAASEARLHQFGAMLDVVQDEAQATVASATGMIRGMRTGAGSLVSDLFSRKRADRTPPTRSRHRANDAPPRNDDEVYARLAALEAAFAEQDDDEDEDDVPTLPGAQRNAVFADADSWDDDEDDDDDEFDDDDEDGTIDDELDDEDDEDGDLDEYEDDELDDEDDDDDEELDEEDEDELIDGAHATPDPRTGGPRIRPRGRA